MNTIGENGIKLGVTAVMLPELDFGEQIELCRSLDVHYYQYRPRVIPDGRRDEPYSPWGNHKFDLTPDRLVKEGRALTARLRDPGLEPWGTVPAMNVTDPDDDIRRHLEGAAVAEAGRVRCQATGYPDGPFDYAAFVDETVGRFAHVVELARPMGLKLIIETHNGTIVAAPGLALNVCRHFSPQDVGVIFDIANFGLEGAVVPHLAVSVLGDYIDCVHIGGSRRVITGVDALGAKLSTCRQCPMSEADQHLPTWVRAIRDAGLNPPLIIEDFTPDVPGAERLRKSAAFMHSVLQDLDASA